MQLVPMASAASVRNKKIVSIIYDDSNSMWQEDQLKWAYANYAVQAFAGMLNKEDTLIINYMSSIWDGIKTPVIIDTNDRKSAVNSIKTHSKAAGTPIESIDVAFNNLKTKADSAAGTQYWLVVMTDGEFYDKNNELCSLTEVESKLCSIADQSMPNGTKPRIVCFSMCDKTGAYTPNANLRDNISVRKADEANEIASEISEIADEISGRYAVDKSEIKQIDEKTLQVTSKIPLVNIGVLSQFSNASVSKVDVDGKSGLNVESNVPIQYPECSGRTTDKSLIGNVAIIGNGADNIPDGTYIITFSEAIKKENVEIMFEPAIELRLKIFSEGEEITDVSGIQVGAELEAEAALYEIGTDNLIDISLLPGRVKKKIEYIYSGQVENSTDGDRLGNIILKKGENIVLAEFELEGYFNLVQSVKINPLDLTISSMTAEDYYDGSERYPGDDENDIYTTRLKKNKTGVRYTLYIDGKPISKEIAQGMLSKLLKSIESELKLKGEVLDDGTIIVYPSKKRFLGYDLFYWLKNRGEQPIKANLDGVVTENIVELKFDYGLLLDMWIINILINIISPLFRWRFKRTKYKMRYGSKRAERGNTFKSGRWDVEEEELSSSNLLRAMLVVLPIPILTTILLLIPARQEIHNGVAVVAISADGRAKLTGISKAVVKTGEYSSDLDLPEYSSGAVVGKSLITFYRTGSYLIAFKDGSVMEIIFEESDDILGYGGNENE